MEREIIYGSKKGTWAPHYQSIFEFYLNFSLKLMYKTAKAVSSAIQRIFPSGIDNKTVIKQ